MIWGGIFLLKKAILTARGPVFEQGDFSFIEKVAKYQGKSSFADLLIQARPQAETFQKLEGLTKNSANWASVKNTLNDPSNASFINKAGFTPFHTWVQQHDPSVALNSQLSLFEVWFGLKNPDKGIIDPSTKQPAAKFPPGVVPADYYTLLDSLATRYSNFGGDQSPNSMQSRKFAMQWIIGRIELQSVDEAGSTFRRG